MGQVRPACLYQTSSTNSNYLPLCEIKQIFTLDVVGLLSTSV